ncbi:hypothetical protein BDB01DRAFT_792396 [Pilobolus umbonatus]|nr:hypothetical protein BDB01DRAFT_792396 [Pilobolus umbonatus]
MEGCFEILIPKNEMMHDDIDFNALMRGEASYHQKRDEEYKDSIVSHGLGSNRYQITIDLSEEAMMEEVKETDDNKVIFDQIREAYTILETKHLKQLNDWINALMRFNIENKSEKDEITKRLLHLKSKANEEVRKAKMLGIRALPRRIPMTAIDYEEDEDYGNEEFEPVDLPSNRKEEVKVESIKLPPLQRIFPLSYEPTMSEDATYAGPLLHENKVHVVPNKNGKGKEKVDEQKEELLKRAPVVEWGEDLYYWDKKNVPFNTSGIEKSHRFMGVGEGDNEMPDQLLDELRKRPIYYESKYPTELRACNHPLHNGGLCPRKDLVTCPFHGRIIPRDELGRPLNPDDIKQSTSSSTGETSEGKKKPDKEVMDNLWELLESDVMAQTGNKLIQPKKKKKEKEKSSLIDIRKKPSTPYARLEQKVSSSKMKKAIDEAIEYERAIKSRNRDASRWK